MPQEIILAAIGVAVLLAAALLVGPALAWLRSRPSPAADQAVADHAGSNLPVPVEEAAADLVPVEAPDTAGRDPASLSRTLNVRVVRIVSWAFLMAVAVFAAVSGAWSDVLPAIVVLIAVTGELLLVFQDVLPTTRLRSAAPPLTALLALAFAGVLVGLTGGLESPFAFTFALIVGGGAVLVSPRLALVLALSGAAALLAAGLAGSPNPSTAALVQLLVLLTGLFLLAFIGSSVGREQRRARDAAIRLSNVDSLTGLSNRSFFFSALEREIARGDRSGRAFCLLMLDVDDLKTTNDRYGHHVGDQVLRAVADIVRSRVRKIDVAARYGGDEFVALLPETDPTGGWVLAEKIRLTVAEQGAPGLDRPQTVSVGVVSYPTDGRTSDALLLSADRAMYASKRGGKNQVARAAADRTVVALEPIESERARQGGRVG
jgi:diguanylate cyclase (GGDEF)-like protein